jgi:hypothetical protein
MAKGKGGKSKGFVSQGVHSNVSSATRRAMRRSYLDSGQRVLNQIEALKKGKDVVMTIENPNKNETNKRFIKVKISSKEWNKKREGGYAMKSNAGQVE